MTSAIETNEKYNEIEDLLLNLVCKEDKKAREFSTADTEFNFARYSNAVKQRDFITDYENIPINMLHSIAPHLPLYVLEGISDGSLDYSIFLTDAEQYQLLTQLRNIRIEEYVEENNYYRMLIGLPPKEHTDKDFIYYKGMPIHKLPLDAFFECKFSGYLDVKIYENPDKPYLWYIGKDINLILAHESAQFDILWTKDGTKYNKYRECFNKERDVYMRTIHSDYLCESTDYAEARELVTIKLQAIIIYKLESTSNELDKAEFTVEEATRIWKEFGLSFPKNMIESYRNTTTFLLNYLVSLKGTNKAMSYISEKLFTGIKLYKYYIRKTHKIRDQYPLPEGTDPIDFYNIEFILRPFYATNINDYKENDLDDKILSYDEVVAMDPRWRDSEELKRAVFESDFSYVESKYLSLNNFIDLSEFTNTFSILIRVLVEHSELLKTKTILMPSIGYNQDAFTILVYYLALITKLTEGKNVIIPDTIDSAVKLLGFRIPENIDELRVRFAWFFTRSEFSWLLDQFPDAINTNESFFNFIVNTDKVIGLDNYMHDLLASCKNWPEYDLASYIFDLVKLVSRSPKSYLGNNLVEEMTYQDWLLKHAPAVYAVYNNITSSKDNHIIELDSITQVLIKFFESNVMPEYNPKNITTVINSFGVMANGVSKYLMYILNMFKSLSCDFLNENIAYYVDEKYNRFQQIENIRIDGHYDIYFNFNNSDYDRVVVEVNRDNIIHDCLIQETTVSITTPVGDIKISNQGG